MRPRVKPGQWALIYLSSPCKELVGAFQIDDVIEGNPSRLWRTLGKDAGIARTEFDRYFREAACGYALMIGKVVLFETPFPLGFIRQRLPDFRPPQSYRYFSPPHPLLDIVPQAESAQPSSMTWKRSSC